MGFARECNEGVNSFASLGAINFCRPDDCIIQPAAANRFFGQPLGAAVSPALGMRADRADVYKMLPRVADR